MLKLQSFENRGCFIHVYPITVDQRRHIETVLNTVVRDQAINDLDWEINFASAAIHIESDPTGYYLHMVHKIPRINQIRLRLGPCEEYQK